MIEIEKQVKAKVIDLSELYPNPRKMPVSFKLRTYLRQVSLNIQGDVLKNNPYLARLVTECSLFLPEMFNERWVKHWEYQSAIALGDNWVCANLDFALNCEDEVLIIDWSGIASDRLVVAQAYLLSQKLNIKPENISVVSLTANPLSEDRRINFVRRLFGDSDFYICQQELNERFLLLNRGEDLNPVPVPEPNELDILLDIENIPEVVID